MKLIKTTFYKVEGESSYGIDDMLRYDTAFVHDGAPGIVAFPMFRSKRGNLGGTPSHARWSSFGYRLTPLTKEPREMSQDWYTTHHPRDPRTRALDYGKLEKVTLAQCLEANDIFDL